MQNEIKQQDLFIAELCHDLKNPLIAQKKMLELILKKSFGEISETQKEMFGLMLGSTNYMGEMLNNLLSYYKHKSGMITLDLKEVCIDKLVISAIDDMKYLGYEKRIGIVYQPSGVIAVMDWLQIKRVVVNIITNSLNYAFADTDLIIRTYSKDSSIVFEFRNTSPEIDEELKSRIFDKFVSKGSGTGLGMYLSKQIVESHGGRIYLEGSGTTNVFGFELPAIKKG